MQTAVSKVTVGFVDGVYCGIPVNATKLSENTYRILPDHDYDDIDDGVLCEFGPSDVVKVKPYGFGAGNQGFIAYELVENGSTDNFNKRLMFYIVMNNPEPGDLLEDRSKDEVKSFLNSIDKASFVYPAVTDWLNQHYETLRNMVR